MNLRRDLPIFLIIFFFGYLLFSFQALSKKREEIKVTELEELIVKPKRQKYKKKGNPAYELMQEIREKAPLYNPYTLTFDNSSSKDSFLQDSIINTIDPGYHYDFYEKIILGLNDMQVDSTSKNLGFLKKYETYAFNTGKPVILLSIKEQAGKEKWRSGKKETTIYGRNNAGVDDAFEQENINKMLQDVLRPIDIFSNDITLLQQKFVSPLGKLAGNYYHYYINDTVVFPDDKRKYIELGFFPVNPESFSFNGRLYVADDSTRFIKKLTMRVPKDINLNYIDNIFVTQEFLQDSLGNRHLVLDDMALEIRIIPGTPSFYARRTIARDNFTPAPGIKYHALTHRKEKNKKIIREGASIIEIEEKNDLEPGDLWPSMRIVSLSEAEKNLAGIHEELKKRPLFYWAEKIVMIVAKGYIGTGLKGNPSKFDFGPVNTFVSYNTLEGVRLRVGGMTTGALSPHIFGKGYVAWGFHDHRWKYKIEGEYSFLPKKIHAREFPAHNIRLTHSYDVDMLGQHYLFTNADNVFLSLKREKSYLGTYQRLSQLEYTLELKNNFSVIAGLRHQIQFATRFVPFINGNNESFGHYSQSSFYVKLRYAPGEVFYEGRSVRMPINMDAPIIQLTHEYGPKRFLGSKFTLNVTELSLQYRLWFSSFGYSDIILKGGKVWSQVQYPALLWPNANLSFTIQPESYSLMNPMEFANDWYGSLDFTYWMNGLLLNRIPLIKKLKLREVLTFKLLAGGLTRKNNPEFNSDLYRFPDISTDVPNYESPSRVMGKKPYMEIGVGLDNIFTILRIDYIWRLTYRNVPGIDKSGLRVSLHFSF